MNTLDGISLWCLVMMVNSLLCLSAPATANDECQTKTIKTEKQAMVYLKKYGYLSSRDTTDGEPNSKEVWTKAIENFQRVANVEMTGMLDEESLTMMNMPRCGMSDTVVAHDTKRKKRYALTAKWSKSDFTFRIINRTPDLAAEEVDRIITEAFQMWSNSSILRFTEVRSEDADILISFATGDHCGADPFDGPNGTLAHAYFPDSSANAGHIHFDEDETFTDGSYSGTNLLWVAVHEIGHSLGLNHSEIESAVMYPHFKSYKPNFQLDPDDIAGIEAQYGHDDVSRHNASVFHKHVHLDDEGCGVPSSSWRNKDKAKRRRKRGGVTINTWAIMKHSYVKFRGQCFEWGPGRLWNYRNGGVGRDDSTCPQNWVWYKGESSCTREQAERLGSWYARSMTYWLLFNNGHHYAQWLMTRLLENRCEI